MRSGSAAAEGSNDGDLAALPATRVRLRSRGGMRAMACVAVACAAGLLTAPARSTPGVATILAFVPPMYAGGGGGIALAGAFLVEGTEPGGKKAAPGTAVITRVGVDAFDMYELIDGARYDAICVRRGDVLGCGWGSPAKDRGVVVYGRAASGVLEGAWRDARGEGHELLIGAGLDFTGVMQVAAGSALADGTAYGGVVEIGLTTGGVYAMNATTAGIVRLGFGLRDGDTLSFGLSPAASCGVVEYRIGPGARVLSGTWIDAGRPYAGVGTETLTRG